MRWRDLGHKLTQYSTANIFIIGNGKHHSNVCHSYVAYAHTHKRNSVWQKCLTTCSAVVLCTVVQCGPTRFPKFFPFWGLDNNNRSSISHAKHIPSTYQHTNFYHAVQRRASLSQLRGDRRSFPLHSFFLGSLLTSTNTVYVALMYVTDLHLSHR